MPPWDEATYFQPAKVTPRTNPTQGTKIVTADPNRVALIISINVPSTGVLHVSSQSSTASSGDLVFTQGQATIQLLFSELGPYVQGDFWLVSSGVTFLTTVEITLNKWPTATKRRRNDRFAPDRR